MDYGHELRFGSFITPSATRPDDVVALTRLSERVGLDLATFQDHPYQPAFLDTWTLLSHLGALTERITLAPNVVNLPLRQPAVLARSVASLDLLTGGRVELGLGAGAFWDAIEAMGGQRLSPGDAVRGLEEAVAILRGVWDTDERTPLRVDGRVHRVAGAKRGPAPAHPVEVWLGAYKPRMLRLVGRVADGWLPSLGYVQVEDLPGMNAAIDEAALAAGRRPGDVRRLLNVTLQPGPSRGFLAGPPDQWVEELAGLALDHGFSTFVVGGDDGRLLELVAAEVAPAVRELVAAERRRPRAGDATRASAAAVGHAEAAPAAGDGAPAPGATAAAGVPAGETGSAPDADALGLRPTPPPQVRRLEEDLLDEATRPRREPEPGVRYTDRGRAAGQHLIDVHDMLRAELEKVRDLVVQLRAGALDAAEARSAVNALTMRQNAWTVGAYCASYCRVVAGHHGLEDDAIFPHLRAQDPALAPVVDRLEAEHHVVHETLEGVDRALVRLVRDGRDGDPAALADLQRAVDALTDALLSHLSYEEAELVEPLARFGFYPGQM